jgi:dTDP-L-rhamnose 4-epimerase
MREQVLITGGAGFIGSHLADELLKRGHRVRIIDSLVAQVHGRERRRPSYLDRGVELVVADIRDPDALERALADVEIVFHFASMVGVGQSMYQISDYVAANAVGTAALLQGVLRRRIKRLVVASSMSIYGEGQYRDANGHDDVDVELRGRTLEQLRQGQWDVLDEHGNALVPAPTSESKTPSLESVYALSKYDQERLSLLIGRAYDLPTVALRFFNVYGPRQALSNPYTGVLAIFASRILNGHPPLIFEDGRQQRDFVNVHDVVRACLLAMENPRAVGRVVNVGSGCPRTILDVARCMADAMGRPHLYPEIPGKYRMGDVRHCYADISLAKDLLGYEPKITFENGLSELVHWLEGQMAKDRVAEARAELETRGLTI